MNITTCASHGTWHSACHSLGAPTATRWHSRPISAPCRNLIMAGPKTCHCACEGPSWRVGRSVAALALARWRGQRPCPGCCGKRREAGSVFSHRIGPQSQSGDLIRDRPRLDRRKRWRVTGLFGTKVRLPPSSIHHLAKVRAATERPTLQLGRSQARWHVAP